MYEIKEEDDEDSSVYGTTEFNHDWQSRMREAKHAGDGAADGEPRREAHVPDPRGVAGLPSPPSVAARLGKQASTMDRMAYAQQRPRLQSAGHSENCLNLQPGRPDSDGIMEEPQRARGRSMDEAGSLRRGQLYAPSVQPPALRSVGGMRGHALRGTRHLSKMLTIHSDETSTTDIRTESGTGTGTGMIPARPSEQGQGHPRPTHAYKEHEVSMEDHPGVIGSTADGSSQFEAGAARGHDQWPHVPHQSMQPSAAHESYPSTRQASDLRLGLHSSSRSNSRVSLPTRGGSATGPHSVQGAGPEIGGEYRSRGASSLTDLTAEPPRPGTASIAASELAAGADDDARPRSARRSTVALYDQSSAQSMDGDASSPRTGLGTCGPCTLLEAHRLACLPCRGGETDQ